MMMNLTKSLLAGTVLLPLCLASPFARADVPNEPPSTQIVSPTDGAMFEGPTASFDVVTDTNSGDGLESVVLRIDGEDVATASSTPWDFPGIELSEEGMHTLVAVAIAPNMDEFPSPAITVGVFGADSETGSGSESSSGGESGTSATTDTMTGEDEGESSNSCAVHSKPRLRGGGGMILLGLFCLGLARRRREG